MHRSLPIAIYCLVLLSSVQADEASTPTAGPAASLTASSTARPSASVHPTKCQFSFPIDRLDREWKWGVGPAGQCEYMWMVTVKLKEATYQIGFSYFNPFGQPKSGSFKQLLEAGQTNVWKMNPETNGASVVDGIKVTCKPDKKALAITVEDKKWSAAVFAQRPALVKLETTGSRHKKSNHAVKVTYKDE